MLNFFTVNVLYQLPDKPGQPARATPVHVAGEHRVLLRPGGARPALQPPALRRHTRAASRSKCLTLRLMSFLQALTLLELFSFEDVTSQSH